MIQTIQKKQGTKTFTKQIKTLNGRTYMRARTREMTKDGR